MTLKLEERKIKLFFFQCSVRGSAGQKGPPPYAECTSPQTRCYTTSLHDPNFTKDNFPECWSRHTRPSIVLRLEMSRPKVHSGEQDEESSCLSGMKYRVAASRRAGGCASTRKRQWHARAVARWPTAHVPRGIVRQPE